MEKVINGEAQPVTRRECDIKHESVDKNHAALWKQLKAIDTRLWVLLVGVFGNLLGLFYFFATYKK